MKALKIIGKVLLALAGCVLMPVLIWVALGAAIYQKAKARKKQRATTPTFGEILQSTGVKGAVEKMKTILIVDDEEVMRDSLKDWLTSGGYEVETAEAGEEALKAMEVKDYDITILDQRLPGIDGIQVLKEAKAKRPHLKGIIMTAYPSAQKADEAKKEGAVDYLSKPLNMNELEKLIRDTLGPVQLQIKPQTRAAAQTTGDKMTEKT